MVLKVYTESGCLNIRFFLYAGWTTGTFVREPVSGFEVFGLFRALDIEADDHPFGIRQVSYDLPNGDWQTTNKSGDSENLVVSRQGRILDQINHFDVVAVLQVFVANLFEVGDCRQGFWSLPRHVQT